MKKLLLASLLIVSSFSVLASEDFPINNVKRVKDGVKFSVAYSKYSAFGPMALAYYGTWNKDLDCAVVDGKLIAKVSISRKQHGPGQAEYEEGKTKNFKIRTKGLCDGQTPDSLIINGKKI